MSLERFNRKTRPAKSDNKKATKKAKTEKDRQEGTASELGADIIQVKPSRSEVRHEQKLLLRKRKQERPCAELVDKLRPLWETMRQKNADQATRQKLINEAMDLIKGNEKELAKKSDSSRILQTIIQYGSMEDRTSLARALGGTTNMANDMYAQHVLKKLIKACSSSREVLVNSLRGNVEHFLTRRIACGVLDDLYRQVNSSTKNCIVRELYSKEFAKLNTNDVEDTLTDFIKKRPAKREIVLNNLRLIIPKLLNKELLMFQIVQRIILDYLTTEFPARLIDAKTLAPFLGDGHIEVLISTNIGCAIVTRIISAANAKDRKAIIKILKPHFPAMIRSSKQYSVILAILSFVDDTVLVGKSLIPEIINGLVHYYEEKLEVTEEIKIILRSVLFILAGRLSKYITPQMVSLLNECDMLAVLTSKKDVSIRRNELVDYVMPLLAPFVEKHLLIMVQTEAMASLIIECFNVVSDEQVKLMINRLLTEFNGFHGLLSLQATNDLIRLAIKKSERLAIVLFEMMEPQLMDLLSGETGFLFVIMIRYEGLFTKLKSRLTEASTIDSVAASTLVSKLRTDYSLEPSNVQDQ